MYTLHVHCTNCWIMAPFMVPWSMKMAINKKSGPIKKPIQPSQLLINYQYASGTNQCRVTISLQTYNILASDAQFQNGATHPMIHNSGPSPQALQFGYAGGVPQQPFTNHLPPLQMGQFQGSTYQQQGHQYDTQGIYSHMPLPIYYPHLQLAGAHDTIWTLPALSPSTDKQKNS